MRTFFLKFENESQAIEALADYRIEDQWLTASVDHALDVVGVIYKPTGKIVTTYVYRGLFDTPPDDSGMSVKTFDRPLGPEEESDYQADLVDEYQHPEMAPVAGYHVNLACESLPDNVKPFIVTPKTPVRGFA